MSIGISSSFDEPEWDSTFKPVSAVQYRDDVIALLTHIEDVTDEENWNRISVELWNRVTQAKIG